MAGAITIRTKVLDRRITERGRVKADTFSLEVRGERGSNYSKYTTLEA
jgi:ribose 1,5-bisphosphokinase PhnN